MRLRLDVESAGGADRVGGTSLVGSEDEGCAMGDSVSPKGSEDQASRPFSETDEELSNPKGWYPAPQESVGNSEPVKACTPSSRRS